MIRRPPRSTLFPTRRSSDLRSERRTFPVGDDLRGEAAAHLVDRKSTRLNSSHGSISYAVFCLKKKNTYIQTIIASETKYTNREYVNSSMSIIAARHVRGP